MATSMETKTLIVESGLGAEDFKDADALFAAGPVLLSRGPGLKTFAGGDTVIDRVSGASRRDFLGESIAELCSRAGAEGKGMEPFMGRLKTPFRWKFPLGAEDGEENVYGHVCGYPIEGAELKSTHAALVELLDWSVKNVERLATDDFLGYYEATPEILERIEEGANMASPDTHTAAYAEEGDGPGLLFAYLGTLRHLMANAITAEKAVLHVAQIML